MRGGLKRAALQLAAAFALASTAPCRADGLRGDIGLYSRYLDLDLLAPTDQPVVQGGLYYDHKSCFAFAWGSHGLATESGGELDIGAYCSVAAGPVTLTGGAMRSFLVGTNDVTTLSLGFAAAGFDLTVERYLWPGNPDGTRVYGGFALQPARRLTLRPMLVYETGLGLPDILAGGLSGEVTLGARLSLTALGLLPMASGPGLERSAQVMAGVKLGF